MKWIDDERSAAGNLLTAQRMWLLMVLAAALGFGLASSRLAQPLRNAWREGLRPGLQVLNSVSDWGDQLQNSLQSASQHELLKTRRQVIALSEQLRERDLQLQVICSDRSPDSDGKVGVSDTTSRLADDSNLPPLVNCRTVSARVLGKQAQAFLQGQDLLDRGQLAGIAAKSLVIDELAETANPPMLDQGRDAAVKPDRLVLSGRRVWGKVADVGPHTSTVLRMCDAGYRDVVQLATQREGRLHFTTRGVLVGTGDPRLCKIELVEISEGVTIGDLVFTANDGVLHAPLLYGRVARLERKPGAAHWEIWMEPSIMAGRPPSRVAILQMELNPARVASGR